MTYLIAYITVLLVFGGVDMAWLSVMGPLIYKPALGDILAPSLRAGPAIAFYAMFPVGVVVFAVLPALRGQTPMTGAMLAALFGAIAYGTYDLTNYATLRNWNLQITLLDIVYGAFASGVAATAAYYAVRAIAR
jgi:uncharacterized membrane protein